jgi:glycine cleavage system aminomethyltransferase T
MKVTEERYIIVINAGHDLTGKGMDHGHEVEVLSDADFILKFKKDGEDVSVKDLSDDYVKIDIQGPLSFKIIKELYGADALRNRKNPDKWMGFFSFNEFTKDGEHYMLSRTGYTNRWGWETYIPVKHAKEEFKKIIEKVIENGGLLVGLGGRDENRLSAGNVGLPLMGQEYDGKHTPTNAPLFDAAIDMSKESFVGKAALDLDRKNNVDKKMVLIISEGNAVDKAVYLDGKRIGSITSSIVSPNVSQEKREFIGSTRKNVLGENGTAAIGLAWLYNNPYKKDAEGNDIPERIRVELYKEVENQPSGKPILAYICPDGITPATAPKALKAIENL